MLMKKILAIVAMLYAAASFAAVDVNKATAAELDGIKGIGPGISAKILDERKKGNFKDWNDFIERVKGIGETNASKFSAEGVTVNGAGFKGVSATPTAKKDDKPAAKAEEKKADAKPTAVAAATDKKAEDKAAKDAEKKAKADEKAKKAEEAKAKKDADKKAADDKKAAAKKDDKPVAAAATPAASAAKK
jgi:competence protein ComEA